MATGLATRCSACSTVFRVVPDQLRVSEGWVRCGRCAEVFNALEGLVDLETGLPKRTLGAGLAPPVASEASEDLEGHFDIAQPAARPGAPALPPPRPAPPPLPQTDLPRTAGRGEDEAWPATAAESVAGDPAASSAAEDAADAADAAAADRPSFIRHAERAARWRSPRVRAALAAVAVLALLVLVAQMGLEYRDLLAARLPATRPWLEQACAPLGCTVDAARAIDSLAVDSSGLVRVEKSNLYRLQVALRNRAGIDLAVPALEITLTDSQGRLMARKVLRLAELGAPQATIGAGRELNVQATLQAAAGGDATAAQPIAGYTIELFYP